MISEKTIIFNTTQTCGSMGACYYLLDVETEFFFNSFSVFIRMLFLSNTSGVLIQFQTLGLLVEVGNNFHYTMTAAKLF